MKPSRKAREEAGGRNQDGMTLPAHECYVIGVDTLHGAEHALYKGRAAEVHAGHKPYDERMLRSMSESGVLEAVRVQLVQVAEDDALWPERARSRLVHVVLLGGNRIVHFRKVLKTAPVGSDTAWQVRCLLDTDKDPRRQFSVQIAENVCRRVLDDEEQAQQIQQGLNVGLTLEELADRLGIKLSKAKRLKARAEGAPAKSRTVGIKAPGRRHLVAAVERLSDVGWSSESVANLLLVIAGKVTLTDADTRVRALFAEDA